MILKIARVIKGSKKKVEEIDIDKILLDKKLYKKILFDGVLCKTFMGAKPLRIRFEKIDLFIKIYGGTR